MKVYLGKTSSKKLIPRLEALGFGEMTVRQEFPPKRFPFALDNGAFRDWKKKRSFDIFKWRTTLYKLKVSKLIPDFIVVPDIVEGGVASLVFSAQHLDEVAAHGKAYLACQDGQSFDQILNNLVNYDGLFVGGSLAWKVTYGEQLVELAHSISKPCHIGRVGTQQRVLWARYAKADSIDSCLPLFSEANLQTFLEGLRRPLIEGRLW